MEGRKIIKWGVSILGVTIIVGYSSFVLYDFVRGPRIIIDSPLSGYSTTTPVITIVGHAIHTNNITINDEVTVVDLAGNFSNRLILAPGYNIIRVTAKDNYKRTAEKTVEITLLSQEPALVMATTTEQVIIN